MVSKTAICFRCHYLSEDIIKEYERLASSCDPSLYEVFMVYDNTRKDFSIGRIRGKKELFDFEDIREMGYRLSETKPIWYNAEYPLLFFFKKHPDYAYYWQLDYDAFFNGRWSAFFDAFRDENADLLAAQLKRPTQEPQWYFWGKHNLDVSPDRQVGVFYPVTRFSAQGLKFLDEKYKEGHWGHCEVVAPTLLDMNGYKVVDFGTEYYDSRWFRWRPTLPRQILPFLPEDKLYHPVKNFRSALSDFFVWSVIKVGGALKKYLRFLGSRS